MPRKSEAVETWVSEFIPDVDYLFKRVHMGFIIDGKLIPGVFKEAGEGIEKGMSTDWEKYSTAEESIQRAPIPEDNGLIKLNAGKIRGIPSQSILHTPDIARNNRAHTDIKGLDVEDKKLKTKIRAKYITLFEWVLKHPSVID